MFGFIKRLFKVGEAEANAAIDKLENPISMIEQGIRDLRVDLDKGLKSLAEVKAMAIRAENEQKERQKVALEYEQKAVLLLKKANGGGLDTGEADRLASEALLKKQTAEQQNQTMQETANKYRQMAAKIESNNKQLKDKIQSYETELNTLRARVQVAKSTKQFNKSMAGVDSNDTLNMLERMKDKINQEEALAESYGEIAASNTSVDDEINKALEGASANPQVNDSLAALKAKLAQEGNKGE